MVKPIIKSRGFTIVELLIVIVVIGILAAITIVAYNGIQGRANDAKIKSAASQIEKAFQIWSVDTGKQPISGSGSLNGPTNDACNMDVGAPGGGWFAATYFYPCAGEDLLRARNLIPTTLISSLPNNSAYGAHPAYVFMWYPCAGNPARWILLWNLANPSADDTSKLASLESTCGGVYNLRDNLGMRTGTLINF